MAMIVVLPHPRHSFRRSYVHHLLKWQYSAARFAGWLRFMPAPTANAVGYVLTLASRADAGGAAA